MTKGKEPRTRFDALAEELADLPLETERDRTARELAEADAEYLRAGVVVTPEEVRTVSQRTGGRAYTYVEVDGTAYPVHTVAITADASYEKVYSIYAIEPICEQLRRVTRVQFKIAGAWRLEQLQSFVLVVTHTDSPDPLVIRLCAVSTTVFGGARKNTETEVEAVELR